MQLKRPFISLNQVVLPRNKAQVMRDFQKFSVPELPSVVDYRNTVTQICTKRYDRIINKQHICQIQVFEKRQIFHEQILIFLGDAIRVLPEVSVLDEWAIRVNFINDRVRVPFVAGSENGYFVVPIKQLETFYQVWSFVKALHEGLFAVRLNDFDPFVWVAIFFFVNLP